MMCFWSWARTGGSYVGLLSDVALVEQCFVSVSGRTCGTGAVLVKGQTWELSDQNWNRIY